MRATYFSHDEDARNDPKITKLRMAFGMEGYGCYFALLEMFSTESSHDLDYSLEQFGAIAYDLQCSMDVREFVDKCIEIGLFQSDGIKFWSESFNRRLREVAEKAKRRAIKSSKAATARWNKQRGEYPETENAPYTGNADTLDGLDADWVRFIKTYEKNVGTIPHGASKTGQMLVDYYNELGVDVMCIAAEATNEARPDNPGRYMLSVLAKWADLRIRTADQAVAAIKDHNNKVAKWKAQKAASAASDPGNGIGGKFY